MDESAVLDIKERKKRIKQQHTDSMRPLRVVEYLDYSTVFSDSPVEISEGYIVSDSDTSELFASFVFKNVYEKRIKSLEIKLHFYLNQNIPYLRMPFTYSSDEVTLGVCQLAGKPIREKKKDDVSKGETFGTGVYIPMPETYFTKLEIELSSVVFADGSVIALGLIAAKRRATFRDLDNERKTAYSMLNIYVSAEEQFPTRVIPQKGEKAWLCCCGTKNLNTEKACERCGRERDWQLENVTEEALSKTVDELRASDTVRVFHDKSNFSQTKFLEDDEDIQRKIKEYETAMKNVAEQQKKAERRRMWIIPKIGIYFAAMALIAFLIKLLMTRLGYPI